MAFAEPLSVPDTMPGAANTTNSAIDLDLEGEVGVQEPAHSVISGKFLWKHSWGSQFRPQSRGKRTHGLPLSWRLLTG